MIEVYDIKYRLTDPKALEISKPANRIADLNASSYAIQFELQVRRIDD